MQKVESLLQLNERLEEQKNLSEQLENLLIDYEILQSSTMDLKNSSSLYGRENPEKINKRI